MKIPTTPDEITAVWLTEALQAGGIIGSETAVNTLRMTHIGEDESFTGGALLRLAVDYSGSAPTAP